MIRRWVNKKNIVELAKYAGLVFCFVAIETIFRVQPEIRTKWVSPWDEVPIVYDILWAAIMVSVLQMIPIKKIRGECIFFCIFSYVCLCSRNIFTAGFLAESMESVHCNMRVKHMISAALYGLILTVLHGSLWEHFYL